MTGLLATFLAGPIRLKELVPLLRMVYHFPPWIQCWSLSQLIAWCIRRDSTLLTQTLLQVY